MTSSARVLAVDLGAASVRVAAVDLAAPVADVEVIHRWEHSPVPDARGSLRWDWPGIVAEVEHGLERALAAGPVESIGVDGWGVDYGLIDGKGLLVSLPYSYRDPRTDGWRSTADAVGSERLYEISGIQIMGINTIFQLAAHDRAELEAANRLLLLPDLLVHSLTGFEGAERSNASTTGLVDARTGDWSDELLQHIDVDRSLLPNIVGAGGPAGSWRGVPLHLVGSHDTASAFLGMPGGGQAGTVFVSAGTWAIVGMEREVVDTSSAARAANFSNEAGALGGFRFLKNVIGFWILEQCRLAWGDPPIAALIEEAESIGRWVPVFDACSDRFLNPADMVDEIRAAVGLASAPPRGVIVRIVLESIASTIALVVDELQEVSGTEMTQLAIVGGGARVDVLHELMSKHSGLPVVVGSSEATALGNGVAQGIALGRWAGREEARRWVQATSP